ncbi:MAG TPA: pyridoxamine 5'-phosphate oxidase family protein [Bacteroidales bacterium]|nr:pyridoxamine 5'-phosphate oxidase family protein [Bacteroidales bacterium]
MNLPDPRIVRFIKEHHVFTLATCVENRPWCSSCYYVFLDDEVGFVITSAIETRHIQEALANTYVAGAIVLESDIAGKLQGLQFEGKLRILDQPQHNKAKVAYVKRFPLTSFVQSTFWYLEVTSLKYTDNRLIPSNKLSWKKYKPVEN